MAVAAEGSDDFRQRHASLLAKAQVFLVEAAEAAAAMQAIEAIQAKSGGGAGEALRPCESSQLHGLWPERVEVWKSDVARFQQGARTSADIAAYADRLGETAGLTLDAARERNLEALVEAQERELLTLQAAEALERAALRRDESMLARLAEELSILEALLRGECQHATPSSKAKEDDAPPFDAGQRLLQRLADKERKLIEQTKQESEELRAAMLETGEHIARCERDASLLADAREAAKALLAADPESLCGQVESLSQALASVQRDIDVLRAGGQEVSNRSMEVAEELSFTEAEVEAECTVKAFAKQRMDVASRAASEQQAIYRLLGTPGSAGINSNILS